MASTPSANIDVPKLPPDYDVKHVAKVHFIIFARQLVEQFADYFDDCPAIQDVKFKFLAAFGDVPKALDTEEFTELLYKFTPLGDKYVTSLLDNFGNLVRPYKPYIEKHDPNVWATLATLSNEHAEKLPDDRDSNLIRDLQIDQKWDECDAETQDTLWWYAEMLLYYGTMYTTYSIIPDDVMSKLQMCAMDVIQEEAGAGVMPTEKQIQKSMGKIAPKIMASLKQEDIMAFGQKMIQNPHMLNDLMGMARNMQNVMPGFNTTEAMKNVLPGGLEGMQNMLSSMSGLMGVGGGGGAPPQLDAAQFAQVQNIAAAMMSGEGGGAAAAIAQTTMVATEIPDAD